MTSDREAQDHECALDRQFIDLCANLLALGATCVKSGTREATFRPMPRQAEQRPRFEDEKDPLDRFPKR